MGGRLPRTLVISDMHIGGRSGHCVLERPKPLEALVEAVRGVERLVLLGDIVELREGRPAEALRIAAPILRALGEAVGPDGEVILVAGNHDRLMIRDWIRQQGEALEREGEVPFDASPYLETLVAALRPGNPQVTIRYPGVALSDAVWATHGHYLDRHLWPVSPYGLIRGGRAAWARPGSTVTPASYERGSRLEVGPVIRWLPAPAIALIEDAAELLRAATMPRIHPGISPVTAALLGLQMRRHSLPALSRVVQRLGVEHPYVIFGHVHRRGPLDGDRPGQWQGPEGTPKLINSGCWRYEPVLLNHAHPAHPYWPGGAVVIDDDDPPYAVGLLDGLTAQEIRAR